MNSLWGRESNGRGASNHASALGERTSGGGGRCSLQEKKVGCRIPPARSEGHASSKTCSTHAGTIANITNGIASTHSEGTCENLGKKKEEARYGQDEHRAIHSEVDYFGKDASITVI